ncbi:MAG: glycosyltransferase family 39 protein, partial [Myxococcales bacterium]|nr:glycosyltransferase family 39 protein [Myxococcales bacterium]
LHLLAAAHEAGVALRLEREDDDDARGRAAGSSERPLRAVLDAARDDVVAAVVLDVALILRDDTAASWRAAADKVDEALRYVPNGRVVVIERKGGISREELETRLATERVRSAWVKVAREYQLAPEGAGDAVDASIRGVAEGQGPDPRLSILVEPDAAALADVLSDAASAHAAIARFKDNGDTVVQAPLDTWLRTAMYRAFGPSELTTRFPGALLGLLALWILLVTARSLWGTRVAVIAGLVLLTMPLFWGQARIASGEPSSILGLTLFACGLLLRARGAASERLAWTYLGLGFLVGFLGEGLFGPLLFVSLALVLPVTSGARGLRDWLPVLVFGALTALLFAWVQAGPADGFAGQFRVTQPLFSEGPSAYSRTFDLVIREIGFGLYPWSPLVVVGVAGLMFHGLSRKDGGAILVAAWFTLSAAALMITQKSFNHLVWAGAPAAALGVGLLFEQVIRGSVKSRFIALALAAMFLLLINELARTPASLVAHLAYDPPFTAQGAMRFPEGVGETMLDALLVLVALALLMMAHFGRLMTFGGRALTTFRKERPFAIAVGVIVALIPLYWLAAKVGEAHRVAASASLVKDLGESQQRFVRSWASMYEPGFLLSLLTIVTLVLTVFLAYVPYIRDLGAKIGRVRAYLPAPRLLYTAAAACFVVLAFILALSVTFPSDYAQELWAPASLVAYLGVAGFAYITFRMTGDRVQAIAVGVAGLALLASIRIWRDGGFHDIGLVALLVAGWLCLAFAALPQLLARPERFALGAGFLIATALLANVIPLLDRYTWIEDVLEPGTGGTLAGRVVLRSVGTWILVLGIALLVVNRLYHDRLAPMARRLVVLERGPIVVAGALFVGLVVTVSTVSGYQRDLGANVSQKHVLDAYHESFGDDGLAHIYKHGNFGAVGRKDNNFYTAGIPEIRDRQTALEVLLASEDQVVTLDTAEGTETKALPGWSRADDTDGDGHRDRLAIRGFATAATESTLTDATQTWTPGSLKGRVLLDASGREWTVVDNDAHSVSVDAAASRLSFVPGSPLRSYYIIDVASGAPDHRATAETPARRALLLPADALSEINYAFRKIAGGRHLPVLDGTSYRVLLAASWLEEGEQQQNRLANATLTQAEYDAMSDPRLHRVSGVYDGEIEVVGYRVEDGKKGGTYPVTIYFKALKPINKSYKLFMHMDLEGGTERIHGDHWILNLTRDTEDQKSCVGCYRTDHWLPGDIVADHYEVDAGQSPAGDYMMWIGFYIPGPDTRVKVTRFDQGSVKHDGQNRLGIGTIHIR